MRRFASVAVMGVTAYFLIATSQAPCRATAETVTLTSRGTCGPDTLVDVSISTSCAVTVTPAGSGLPGNGLGGADTNTTRRLVDRHLNLQTQSVPDGGSHRNCALRPNDAGTGWDVECNTECGTDGGSCECTGTVTP